jgi:hypothetical protein
MMSSVFRFVWCSVVSLRDDAARARSQVHVLADDFESSVRAIGCVAVPALEHDVTVRAQIFDRALQRVENFGLELRVSESLYWREVAPDLRRGRDGALGCRQRWVTMASTG